MSEVPLQVTSIMYDPRGSAEELALLRLDHPADYRPAALDDAGHIGAPQMVLSCFVLNPHTPHMV